MLECEFYHESGKKFRSYTSPASSLKRLQNALINTDNLSVKCDLFTDIDNFDSIIDRIFYDQSRPKFLILDCCRFKPA